MTQSYQSVFRKEPPHFSGSKTRQNKDLTRAVSDFIQSEKALSQPALLVDRLWTPPMPSLSACGAVFGIAALSAALAYVLHFRILATAGATNLLLMTFLIPISTIVSGSLMLGERPNPQRFLGAALIGSGLAGSEWATFKFPSGHCDPVSAKPCSK